MLCPLLACDENWEHSHGGQPEMNLRLKNNEREALAKHDENYSRVSIYILVPWRHGVSHDRISRLMTKSRELLRAVSKLGQGSVT